MIRPIPTATATATVLATAFALIGCGWTGASAQESPRRDAWVESLAAMTDGAWITSNARYQEEDGGIEVFGMKLDLMPGGLAAVGCLWGEIEGEVVGVYWQFFQGWDPVAEKGMIYQSSESGAVAMGYLDGGSDAQPELVQTLVELDGARSRIGHFESWTDAETRVSRSVEWIDGRWAPRRSYTWVRERDHEAPC